MAPQLKPIEPKSTRWEPTSDPNDIVVPGLDTAAPVNDQVEQIEQLITIKLQNIDANFSKIQQIMANRILPAVKRYAVGTEPVREAAKFWTTFFEQAAQIRVPTYEEDPPTAMTSESVEEISIADSTANTTPTRDQSFNPDGTSSEVSFAPDAAIMSTPATARHKSQFSHGSMAYNEDPSQSWNASIESPLIRLDREIQSLTRDDEVSLASTSMLQDDTRYDELQDITQRQIETQPVLAPPQSAKARGKSREPPEPLLHNVLRRNADVSVAGDRTAPNVSPLKVKSRTPILKALNPYLPPDTKPSDWKGVVDLADPTVATPRGKATAFAKPRSAKRSVSKSRVNRDLDLDDDSFDDKLRMSPPITMDFARLPKAKTPKLGRTPKKAAAERIMKDLVATEKHGTFSSVRSKSTYTAHGGAHISAGSSVETSVSNVPTPPSLSRYARHPYPASSDVSSSLADASLESMMRRVGLDMHGFDNYGMTDTIRKPDPTAPSSAAPSLPSGSASSLNELNPFSTSVKPQGEQEVQGGRRYSLSRVRDDDLDMRDGDSSSDSLDYEDDGTVNPLAPQGPSYEDLDDDDDDDDLSDSFGDEGGAGYPPGMEVNDQDPFDDDDSFDDNEREEETLFGVPPAQRLAHEAQTRMSEQNLRMLGHQLLEDTIGIGAQMAKAGRVEETPTPWPGAK